MAVAPSDGDPSSPDRVVGLGRVTLDRMGRIVSLDPVVARWFGIARPRAVGLFLGDVLDRRGREWLEATLPLDGLGAQECAVHTRTGRALRFWPRGELRFTVADDSTVTAVMNEREGRACDGARAGLAAAVARELNDPMSIVQGRLELLLELDSTDPDMLRRHLSVALDHARRISNTLHQLRLVGGPLDGNLEASSARRLLLRAAALVGDVDLHLDLRPSTLRLLGSPDLLVQVLVGLVRRIRDAARGDQVARAVARETNGHTVVELRAESPRGSTATPTPVPGDPRLDVGVSELVLSRIGGRLEALRLGRGLLYRLVLPQAPPHRRRPSHDAHVLVVGTVSPTDLCALLYEEGVDTTCVADAEGALASLEQRVPDGLVASLHLPGISGLTLLSHTLSRWPRLTDRVVLVTRTSPPGVPDGARVCHPPVDRRALLHGLGIDTTG